MIASGDLAGAAARLATGLAAVAVPAAIRFDANLGRPHADARTWIDATRLFLAEDERTALTISLIALERAPPSSSALAPVPPSVALRGPGALAVVGSDDRVNVREKEGEE